VHEERGKMFLAGTVDSESERERAGQVAKGTPGVGEVVNQLVIETAPGTAPIGTPGR
jgi:osmotically-inducible protein OsmY